MAGAASLDECCEAVAAPVRTAQPDNARKRRLAGSTDPRTRPQAQASRGFLTRGVGVRVGLGVGVAVDVHDGLGVGVVADVRVGLE
eukprot:12024443-Alexandrium_andersonii.AAC.1